ncbi:MAG: hypothetical protein WCG98_06690 [bacterium]
MIKFVVSRPISKIKRSRIASGKESRIKSAYLGGDKQSKSRRRSLKILRIILILFAVVYGGFLLLKSTLFAKEYTIAHVNFTS